MAANSSSKRDRVALALAAGTSIRRAAHQCAVGARTIHTWLEQEPFRERVSQLRTQFFNRTVGRLSRASGKAAAVLEGLLNSQDERVKLAAAKSVLETGMKAREALELAQGMDEIKTILRAKGVLK